MTTLRKNLYNVDAFKRLRKDTSMVKVSDSNGGLLLARQLQYISPEVFEQQFPDLVLLNMGFTVNNEGGYSSTITSLRTTPEGHFSQTSDKSHNVNKISLSAQDSDIKVYTYSAFSEWSETELRRAELANVNLPSKFIGGHNEIYMRDIDRLGLVGVDSTDGAGPATGLLNYSGFASSPAAQPASSGTSEQNYNAIANLIRDQWSGINNITSFKASRVLMPIDVMNIIATQPFNSTYGDGTTVLAVLRQNFPDVTFMSSTRCDSVGGSSRTIACSVDRRAMQIRIPRPLQFWPTYQNGPTYRFDSEFSIAGLDVFVNESARVLTGL